MSLRDVAAVALGRRRGREGGSKVESQGALGARRRSSLSTEGHHPYGRSELAMEAHLGVDQGGLLKYGGAHEVLLHVREAYNNKTGSESEATRR